MGEEALRLVVDDAAEGGVEPGQREAVEDTGGGQLGVEVGVGEEAGVAGGGEEDVVHQVADLLVLDRQDG